MVTRRQKVKYLDNCWTDSIQILYQHVRSTCTPSCSTCCSHGNHVTRRQITAQNQISRQLLCRFYSNFVSARVHVRSTCTTCTTCCSMCCAHGNRVTMVTRRQITAQSQISRQPLSRFYSNFVSISEIAFGSLVFHVKVKVKELELSTVEFQLVLQIKQKTKFVYL